MTVNIPRAIDPVLKNDLVSDLANHGEGDKDIEAGWPALS
jgi:hypothetical protein